jgi:hypothetical protein
MKHPSSRQQLPETLRELLAKPMLWRTDQRRLLRLARRHSIRVALFRRDLNDWDEGYRLVRVVGDDDKHEPY